MKFGIWLETKIGSVGSPLYHYHPNVLELKKKGFTAENLDPIGSGIASTSFQGQRAAYGAAGGIHLSRDVQFCINNAKKMGPTAGVVEVIFNLRKPFFVHDKSTAQGIVNFGAFVNPEDKYLVPLTNNKVENMRIIANTITHMKTTYKVMEEAGNLGQGSNRDAPVAIQAKSLAREFVFGGNGFARLGWPIQFRDVNPSFEETLYANLRHSTWKEWADKGYIDSVWWEHGTGAFHGESEVTVFDPRRLRVGSIVYLNSEQGTGGVSRARRRW
jgi:hypothetical protein